MKKILLFAVSMVFAVGLMAQSSLELKVQKQPSPQEMRKIELSTSEIDIRSVSESKEMREILANPIPNAKDVKDEYTPWGWADSREYTYRTIGEDDAAWKGEEQMLFPDNMAGIYRYIQNYPSLSGYVSVANAMGYVFDPYSLSYGETFDQRCFETSVNYLHNYRIDTLDIAADYRIANYNPNSPDTLRISLSHFDIYSPKLNLNIDYFTAIAQSKYKFLSPAVQYIANPIPAKGITLKPKASNTITFDYILSPKDSVLVAMGYVRGKVLSLPVNYEVPSGSVVGVIMKFIPGYTYDNKDTLVDERFNSSGNITYYKTHRNTYSSVVINNRSGYTTDLYDSGYGYNTTLMEDLDLRNKTANAYTLNGSYCYDLRYDYLPIVDMKISTGTESVLYEPTPVLEETTEITEIHATLNGSVTVGINTIVNKGFLIRKKGTTDWEFVTMPTGDNNQFSKKVNLIPNTEYEVCTYVQAGDYRFVWISKADTFKTLPNETTFIMTPPTSITRTSATLNATLSADIVDRGVYNCMVRYRKAGSQSWSGYYELQQVGSSLNVEYRMPSGRLTPATTYEVEGVITSSWLNYTTNIISPVITFQTLPSGPVLNTIMASDITRTSAVLNGNIVEDSTEPTIMCGFEWRKQGDSVYSVASSATSPLRSTLTELQPNTTYEFRAFAMTDKGSYYGNIAQFSTLSTGIAEVSSDMLSLYPNPTSGKIFIKTITPIEKISVYDINGKEVKSINDVQDHFSIGELKDGVYLIKLKTVEGEVLRKIIKQ